MAREPMVTRTITTTKVDLLCMDVETAEPFNTSATLPRTYKYNEKIMKIVRPMIETDRVKVVHIVGKEEIETLYGMTEKDFIEHAKELEPRKVKETATVE